MGAIRKIINKSGKPSWQIDYIDPAGKRVRQTFKKKKDADGELGKRVSLIAEKRYLDVKKEYKTTFGELGKKYEENFQTQASYQTAKKFFIEKFKTYFEEDTLLANIRFVDLETYRNHLRQELNKHNRLLSVASINRELSCLRHMFKKAVEWEMIDSNPFKRGSSLHEKENNQRLRYLEVREINDLLEACSTKVIQFPHGESKLKKMTRKDTDYLRFIVECALHTGMRKGEILSLKWDQIQNGFIYLKKTKTNEPRQIPINDDLSDVFSQIRKKQHLSSKYVFTFEGKPVDSVKVGFNSALKRAGISDFRFHDLRHTFASHFVMRGGSLKELQEILGHKTMTMTLRYAHLSKEHKRKAVNLLNGLTTSQNENGQPPQEVDLQSPMSENVRFDSSELSPHGVSI